jgi:hypothetical protein
MLSVCWAWLVVYPGLLQLHLVLTRRIVALSAGEYLQSLAPGLGGAALMVLGMAVTLPLGLHQYGALTSLSVWLLVGAGIYIAYLRVVLKVELRDLVPNKQLASASGTSAVKAS